MTSAEPPKTEGLGLYEILDEWWRERFDHQIGDRVNLPLDQAYSLYEHCEARQLIIHKSRPSGYRLEPVYRPWDIEHYDLAEAVGGAKMSSELIAMASGNQVSMGPFGSIKYNGMIDLETGKAVGPYLVDVASNTWQANESRILRINLLAMYAHHVYLSVGSILPKPPPEGVPGKDRWLQDVHIRLSLMMLYRGLSDAGAISFCKVDSATDSKMSGDKTALLEDEVDSVLQGIELRVRGKGIWDDPLPFFRLMTAQHLAHVQLIRALDDASDTGANLFVESSYLERLIRLQLANASETPMEKLMQRWLTVAMPMPEGSTPQIMTAVQHLCFERDILEDWRSALTDSLILTGQLVASGASAADMREALADALAPRLRKLKQGLTRTELTRKIFKGASKDLTIGATTFGSALALDEAASAHGAGLLAAGGIVAYEYLRSRQRPKSTNVAWDAYVALGLNPRTDAPEPRKRRFGFRRPEKRS